MGKFGIPLVPNMLCKHCTFNFEASFVSKLGPQILSSEPSKFGLGIFFGFCLDFRSISSDDMAAKPTSLACARNVEPQILAAVRNIKWHKISFAAYPVAKLFVLGSMTQKHLPCKP